MCPCQLIAKPVFETECNRACSSTDLPPKKFPEPRNRLSYKGREADGKGPKSRRGCRDLIQLQNEYTPRGLREPY